MTTVCNYKQRIIIIYLQTHTHIHVCCCDCMYVYSIMCRLFRFVATNHKKLCMMAPPTRHFTSVQYDLDDLDLRCCGSDHQKLHTTNPWDWSHQACTVLFSRLGPRDGGCAEFYIIPAEASSHSYCAGNNTNGARYISCTC